MGTAEWICINRTQPYNQNIAQEQLYYQNSWTPGTVFLLPVFIMTTSFQIWAIW